MHPFTYVSAKSIDDVVAALKRYGRRARCLAGGTDILVQTRGERYDLDALVDIKAVPELMERRLTADRLELGAAVPCYQVYEDKRIAKRYPGLIDAASLIGGIQIQSRASLGGNLCNASPSADGVCPLIVHSATAVIVGPAGTREVPVEEFSTAPGRTVLRRGEFLTTLRVPRPPAHFGAAYLRFIPRNEMDIAVAGVASSVRLNAAGNRITAARIALAAVGPTAIVAAAAAAALVGAAPTNAAFAHAGELAAQAAKPIEDMRGTVEHRLELVRVLTRRTLAIAAERAKGTA